MSITAKIKDAESNYHKWRRIVGRGVWSQYDRTESQALALMHYHEGRLEAFTEAKQLTKVKIMIKVGSRVNYHPLGFKNPPTIKHAEVYYIDLRKEGNEVMLTGWTDRSFPLANLKRIIK